MSDTTKPGESVIDNQATENTTDIWEYLVDDKALKRKMKKERRKDKKNHDKPRLDSETEDDTNESEKFRQTEYDEQRSVNNDDNDANNSSRSEEDESADINYSTMVSAFIQSIVTKNDTVKNLKKHDSNKGKDSVKDTIHKANPLFTDVGDGFTCIKKGGKQAPITFYKTPEGFGNEALRVIREGNYQLAINYLTRAIALDPSDTRHYINRSYCLLREGEFSRAMTDIQFATQHFTDITEMSRAKCREGQAYCGLQNYEAAERAFRESINLAPDFLWAYRELKRMQVLQLVLMGFNERDALLALQKHPSIMEALNTLAESASTNTPSCDSPESDTVDEDELFYSDSEDNPSNERLLSKMINYDPSLPEEPRIYEPPPTKEIIARYHPPPRAPSVDRAPPLRVIKAMVVPTKPKKSNQNINDKAVWVGSLQLVIQPNQSAANTEAMLQKRFSRFGKVINVWIPPNVNYAFVNFQCSTGPQKAFEEAKYNGGSIDLNGVKLPIKEATKSIT